MHKSFVILSRSSNITHVLIEFSNLGIVEIKKIINLKIVYINYI